MQTRPLRSAALRLLLMPVAVLCAALMLSGYAPASPPPPTPHVWLHYDYLVYPDGHSDAPDPAAIQQVVDVYAAHGIQLEIDNHHTSVPTSNPLLGISDSGDICPGALDVADVRAQYFHPTSNHEWHYALFGDQVVGGRDCSPAGGWAELAGDNFVVSMEVARKYAPNTSQVTAAMFMHELGHNLGLRHGGGDDINYKPNYLSVMNYAFNVFGIPYSSAPGGTTFAGYRLDYSESALPTLDLAHLNESVGIQAGTNDITLFKLGWDPLDPGHFFAGSGPASGPIDWNLDGTINTDVAATLVNPNCCFLPEILTGFDDWAEVRGYILGTIAHGPKTIAHEDAAEQPVVSGISPAGGPPYGGTAVTISGTHLGKTTEVLFGLLPATSFTIVNQQTIVAVSPQTPSPGGGAVDVHVLSDVNPSPSVPADLFTYAPWQTPVVQSISPTAGPLAGGTTVTIHGSHLAGASNVSFGSQDAAGFTVVDDDTIRAISPPASGQTSRSITVTTPGGTSPGDVVFFTYAAAPVVQGISPTVGPLAGGTPVTIQVGSNELYNGVTGVSFGTTPGVSFTQPIVNFPNITITAVAPSGAGTVDVTVTNAGGTSATVAADQYSYLPLPSVTSLSPNSGLPGTLVTIHGSHFTGAIGVCFGSTCLVAWTLVDDTTITVAAPSDVALEGSTVDVTVLTPQGTSPTGPGDLFTLL